MRWNEKEKNHTSNGLERDETECIGAKQNNSKDEKIWLANGHLTIFPVLSLLVCLLDSLHQPFGLGFYALECGCEERRYLDVFTCLVCVLKPLISTPNSSSVWGKITAGGLKVEF